MISNWVFMPQNCLLLFHLSLNTNTIWFYKWNKIIQIKEFSLTFLSISQGPSGAGGSHLIWRWYTKIILLCSLWNLVSRWFWAMHDNNSRACMVFQIWGFLNYTRSGMLASKPWLRPATGYIHEAWGLTPGWQKHLRSSGWRLHPGWYPWWRLPCGSNSEACRTSRGLEWGRVSINNIHRSCPECKWACSRLGN